MLEELIGGVPKNTNCGQDENGARDVCLLATTKILVERRRQVRAFSTWSHLRILDAILPTDHRTGTITVCFALQSRFYLLFITHTHTHILYSRVAHGVVAGVFGNQTNVKVGIRMFFAISGTKRGKDFLNKNSIAVDCMLY